MRNAQSPQEATTVTLSDADVSPRRHVRVGVDPVIDDMCRTLARILMRLKSSSPASDPTPEVEAADE